MPKRRRNPDGSLVTPLSPRQQEVLARGRAVSAAKLTGAADRGQEPAGPGAAAGPGDEPAGPGAGRTRVETVTVAGGRRATATKKKRSTHARTPPAPAPGPSAERGGLLERVSGWLRE